MVHLDYRDARPIYSQIIDGIRQQIRSEILLPGDRLPSVRELAAQLTINPNTIQRAYRELEATGWITSVSGKGCFVCERPRQDDGQALLEEFDRVTQALLQAGFTPETLASRLRTGGKNDA